MQAAQTQSTNKQLQEAYHFFVALVAEQRSCMAAIPQETLKIFRSCSHLDTIFIAQPDQDVAISAWPSRFQKAMVRPWLQQEDTVGGHLFVSVLASSVIAQRRPRRLEIGALSYEYFKDVNVPTRRNVFSSVDSLECLSIAIENNQNTTFDDAQLNEPAGQLAGFLTLAPRLRELRVEIHTGLDLPLHGIVGAYTWHHLARVCLERFSCTSDGLVSFLTRHNKTLVELRLISPIMDTSEWESCFKRVSGTFPKLERVYLRGWFEAHSADPTTVLYFSHSGDEDQFTKKVQDYIIKGGDDMPESYDELIPLMSNHPANNDPAMEED